MEEFYSFSCMSIRGEKISIKKISLQPNENKLIKIK